MKFVIIGSSAAGITAAKTIREHDQNCEITIISRDSTYYSRCQLHLVASGFRTEQQATLAPEGWEKQLKVNFLPKRTVTDLNIEKKTVGLEDGEQHSFDQLLIATGSRSTLPPVTGIEGPGVFGLRNLEDAAAIRESMHSSRNYVIIGAGLVGVELALKLAHAGKQVSLVEMAPFPLPMQLESETGALCKQVLENAGIKVFCGHLAGEVVRGKDGRPQQVLLKSGAALPADIVVAAAGVKANIEFAVAAGLNYSRGLVIDERCQTSVSGIYAAGDVAETIDALTEQITPSAIWPTAVRQGKIAAMNMLGLRDAALERNTGFKASVVLEKTAVISLGPVYKTDPSWERKVFRSTASSGQHSIKIFYLHENKLKAALLWGDVTNAGLYFEAIVNKRPIEKDMPHLDRLDAAKRGFEQLHVL